MAKQVLLYCEKSKVSMQESGLLRSLSIYPDAEQLAEAGAERITAVGQEAIARRGRFCLALAGGATPRATYERLGNPETTLDWSRVHVFWSDERCVPPDHADSNYRTARLALLDRVAIPAENVHRIPGELPPEQAAAAYRAELHDTLGADGRFDLVLLGMGDDGHTASLFPGTPAVEVHDTSVVAVYAGQLDSWRVTLTLPAINAARHVLFMVSGASKASALARVRGGERLPAGLVRPVDGELTWLVDQAAVSVSRPGRQKSRPVARL